MPWKPNDNLRRKKKTQAWRNLRDYVIREEDWCGVCGQVVDKNLSGDELLGPTAGHIISVRERPDLELVRSNVELQHRICNLKQGS
jgi:5-methylcytosine-specific restriction endonuclease McrA